ncbi:hypothetical protein [Paraburkholderia strydomiana]
MSAILRGKVSFLLIFLLLSPKNVFAQCANSILPSCNVYESCFERYCPCKDKTDEYFLSFGKKYCEAFLSNTSLSEDGKKWREATLTCLQEKVVEVLPIDDPKSCDCSKMKAFAMGTHVACYTLPGKSICDLPISDIGSISNTIIFNKTFIDILKEGPEATKQVRAVFEKCSTSAKEDDRRKRWAFLLRMLNGKLRSN